MREHDNKPHKSAPRTPDGGALPGLSRPGTSSLPDPARTDRAFDRLPSSPGPASPLDPPALVTPLRRGDPTPVRLPQASAADPTPPGQPPTNPLGEPPHSPTIPAILGTPTAPDPALPTPSTAVAIPGQKPPDGTVLEGEIIPKPAAPPPSDPPDQDQSRELRTPRDLPRTLREGFAEFLEKIDTDPSARHHLFDPTLGIHVAIRGSKRPFGEVFAEIISQGQNGREIELLRRNVSCLDIADVYRTGTERVDVAEFQQIISEIYALSSGRFEAIYIHNVHEKEIQEWCEANGWSSARFETPESSGEAREHSYRILLSEDPKTLLGVPEDPERPRRAIAATSSSGDNDKLTVRVPEPATPDPADSVDEPPPPPPADPIPGDYPDEFRRIVAMGYTLPELDEIPSYEDVTVRMGIPPEDLPSNTPFGIFEDLQSRPDAQPTTEDYIGVALEVLKTNGYPQEALDYAEHVGFPSLIALHDDHATRGPHGVIGSFLENMIAEDSERTRLALQTTVGMAIDFVARRDRDEITPQIYRVLDDWMERQNNGTTNTDIQGIVVFGSFPRGDATAFSDLDVALFVGDSSPQTYHLQALRFSTFANARIREIQPSFVGIKIWGSSDVNPFYTLDTAGEIRAALTESEIEIDAPEFARKIFATNNETATVLERATRPER